MNCTPIKIELVTELGTFIFEKHHCSTADFYQAMNNFEANNWEKLGDTSYILHLKFDDGVITQTHFKGMNNTADLAFYMDPEED
jgi:hypothetical protein